MSNKFEDNKETREVIETAQLETPSIKYKGSFIEALKEFHKEGKYIYLDVEELENDFDAFLQNIPEIRKEINKVPESEFWLINNDQYIGRISIRHELNDELLTEGGHIGYAISPLHRKKGYGKKALELGLMEAKKLGLKKVLITTDNDNLGSIAIIESQGGILENEVSGKEEGPPVLRYWIDLSEE